MSHQQSTVPSSEQERCRRVASDRFMCGNTTRDYLVEHLSPKHSHSIVLCAVGRVQCFFFNEPKQHREKPLQMDSIRQLFQIIREFSKWRTSDKQFHFEYFNDF